jgi:hypothetical protein
VRQAALTTLAAPYLRGVFQTQFLEHVGEHDIPEHNLDEQDLFNRGMLHDRFGAKPFDVDTIKPPLWCETSEFKDWCLETQRILFSIMKRDPFAFRSGVLHEHPSASTWTSLIREVPLINAHSLDDETERKFHDTLKDGVYPQDLPDITDFMLREWKACWAHHVLYLRRMHATPLPGPDPRKRARFDAIMRQLERLRPPPLLARLIEARLLREGHSDSPSAITRVEKRGLKQKVEDASFEFYSKFFEAKDDTRKRHRFETELHEDPGQRPEWEKVWRRAVVGIGDHILTKALREDHEKQDKQI